MFIDMQYIKSTGVLVLILCWFNCAGVSGLRLSESQIGRTHPPAKCLSLKGGLKTQLALSGKLQVLVPKDFVKMSSEEIRKRYLLEGKRPTEVFTNTKGDVNFAFKHTLTPVTLEQLPQVQPALVSQIAAVKAEFINNKFEEVNGHPFVILEFISPLQDGSRVYNLMYATSLDDKLLLATFNCPYDQLTDWQDIAHQMMNSIEVLN